MAGAHAGKWVFVTYCYLQDSCSLCSLAARVPRPQRLVWVLAGQEPLAPQS